MSSAGMFYSALIVDDDRVLVHYLERMLKKMGLKKIINASAWEDITTAMKVDMPDLVLLDIHLTGSLDGIETARTLNSLYSVPVILVTGDTGTETFFKARSTEISGYLIKPVTPLSLYAAVSLAFNRYELEEELVKNKQKLINLYLEKNMHLQKVIEERAKNEAILASLGDGLCIVDRDFTIEYQNNTHRRDFGNLKGMKCYEAFFGRGAQCDMCRSIGDTGVKTATRKILFPDGLRIYDVTISSYRLPSGDAGGIIENFRDVTDYKEIEKRLQDAYYEGEQILNTTDVGMWLLDGNGIVQKVNSAFLGLFSIDGALLGKEWHEIADAMGIDRERDYYSEVINDRARKRGELKVPGLDGETTEYTSTAVPFLYHDGRVAGVLESFTDVSELRSLQRNILKKVEQERRRIGRDLHDSLGQKLTGLSYLLESLKKNEKGLTPDGEGVIRQSVEIISGLIEQTRSMARGLNPVNLHSSDLQLLFKDLLQSTEMIFNVKCSYDCPEDIHVEDNDTVVNLFYIAQEAVNNALRHSSPENISVFLKKERNILLMVVENDGFSPVPGGENGLKGIGHEIMRYRAGIIGGDIYVDTGEETYMVSVKVPL